MNYLRRLLARLRGQKYLLFENRIWLKGEKVSALTDWNLGVGEIRGKLIVGPRGEWRIKGQVVTNTDNYERVFPVYDCWEMKRI